MYKASSSAFRLGLAHGKDAYLLDKEINNPFCPIDEIINHNEYEEAWNIGYEEESSFLRGT